MIPGKPLRRNLGTMISDHLKRIDARREKTPRRKKDAVVQPEHNRQTNPPTE